MSWRSIRFAPQDGTHILAADMSDKAGFGWPPHPGEWQPTMTVVHWWSNPGEEGWYTSVNEQEPQRPFNATHFQRLPEQPKLRPCGCVDQTGEFCKECY